MWLQFKRYLSRFLIALAPISFSKQIERLRVPFIFNARSVLAETESIDNKNEKKSFQDLRTRRYNN